MRNNNAIACAGLLALMLTASGAVADDKTVMEKLKTLEGEWTLLDENGEDTGVIGSSFRLTAAGSALVELMMPGNPDGYEMVNMYHADGDRVLMTHYCAAGNQPRLEVKATDDENRLELSFESITNLASPDANHMHQAEYIFHGEDHVTARWQNMADGEIDAENTVAIEMKRKK